jgi:hypothetical protein
MPEPQRCCLYAEYHICYVLAMPVVVLKKAFSRLRRGPTGGVTGAGDGQAGLEPGAPTRLHDPKTRQAAQSFARSAAFNDSLAFRVPFVDLLPFSQTFARFNGGLF